MSAKPDCSYNLTENQCIKRFKKPHFAIVNNYDLIVNNCKLGILELNYEAN